MITPRLIQVYFPLAVLLVLANPVCAQNRWNVWCFGSLAGLDFNTGEPTPLQDASLTTVEGCASICDKYGKLLFYTDGQKVWNRSHSVMPNGIDLFGHASTTQTLILPHPTDSSIYYIVTADAQGGPRGLRYSTVNLASEGGLGDVIEKNTLLKTPISEKITAVKHLNGRDYWIVTHEWNSDRFLVFPLTDKGLIASAKPSIAGAFIGGGTFDGNAIGAMKANLQGTMLAVAIHDDNIIDLLYFNNETGKVTHKCAMPIGPGNGPYGLEFSPNGKFLYASLFFTANVLQYELDFPTSQEIMASADTLFHDVKVTLGALQLAPDGRIYASKFREQNLAAINFPDRAGAACEFVRNALDLGGRSAAVGLPNSIPEFIPSFRYRNICLGDSTYFSVIYPEATDSAVWDFGDPASGMQNFSRKLNPAHLYAAPGPYLARLVSFKNGYTDTTETFVNIMAAPLVDLGADTVLCTEAFEYELIASCTGCHYFWWNSSSKPTYTVKRPGIYWVRVYNHCGSYTDTIKVGRSVPPQVDLGKDTVFCDEVFLELSAECDDCQYLWQDGSASANFLITQPGTYHVQAHTACGTVHDTIQVGLKRCDIASWLEVPNVFTPNGDGINDFFEMSYKNIDQYHIEVYNRWGQLLFVSDNIQQSWDAMHQGKKLAQGTYYYRLSALGADTKAYKLEGTVSLFY